MNKFLKIGLTSILTAFISISPTLASESNEMEFNSVSVATIVQANIAQEELLSFFMNEFNTISSLGKNTSEKIQKIIKETFKEKAINPIEKIKEITNTDFKDIYKDIPISVKYSYPQQLINDVNETHQYKSNRKTDGSVAHNAFDVAKDCSVEIRLAVDKRGRLVESSEFTKSTIEQVSSQLDNYVESTIKATVFHEISHCLLHKDMQDPNFKLSLTTEKYGNNSMIEKGLNDRIKVVLDQIQKGEYKEIKNMDYLIYSNFHENFSDVMSAFLTMGNNPTKEDVTAAQHQLLTLSEYRSNDELTHRTTPAIQYALTKLGDASKMDIKERKDLALQIASDSLLSSLDLVVKISLNNSDGTIMSSILLGDFDSANKVVENGVVLAPTPVGGEGQYNQLLKEIRDLSQKNEYGTLGQQKLSMGKLMKLYGNADYLKNREADPSYNYEPIIKPQDKLTSLDKLFATRTEFSKVPSSSISFLKKITQ